MRTAFALQSNIAKVAVVRPEDASFRSPISRPHMLAMAKEGSDGSGLYVGIFNWLEGPPAFAPGLFAGLAAAGLVAANFL